MIIDPLVPALIRYQLHSLFFLNTRSEEEKEREREREKGVRERGREKE